MWEPFVEPWKFQINMIRKQEMTAHLNSSILTDIDVTSTMQLNLNCTESLIEVYSAILHILSRSHSISILGNFWKFGALFYAAIMNALMRISI